MAESSLSDYDQMRAEATALPRRKVVFDLAIPIDWFLVNDFEDLDQIMDLHCENGWGPRGAQPNLKYEWQRGVWHSKFNSEDGKILHSFMQYIHGPHEDEYSGKELFVIHVRIFAELHRFVFGPADGSDRIDREGL